MIICKREGTAIDTETDLLTRCRRGETEAWDALFDKYYPVVGRFVFQLSPEFSREDTEEICQETFLAVVRNLESFRGKSAFQTWLLRVASNKAIDFRERTRAVRRGGGAIHLSIHGSNHSEEVPIDPPSLRPGPDALLMTKESFRLVRQSLDRIGEPCREIIELRYYGDLSYEEIARALNLNPKTVSSRLSKCLTRLQAMAKKIFPADYSFTV
jgi:RNA polymerase sigma-70 factor (ECF subfamily)